MAHTITITRLPSEESDDYEYVFGGTHDRSCMSGVACKRKACQAMSPDYDTERVRHGRDHWHLDGTWWVEDTERCGLNYVFEHESYDDQMERAGLGTHTVDVEWDGDWWLLWIEEAS